MSAVSYFIHTDRAQQKLNTQHLGENVKLWLGNVRTEETNLKMNFVLLGFGLGLVIIALVVLYRSTLNTFMQNTAVFFGFSMLGVGILVCIIAGWLIEREHVEHRRKR